MVKGKVCIRAKLPVRPALISGFCSINRLGAFLPLPPPPPVKWDASSSRNYTGALNSPVAIYTQQRVERGTVGVTCFAQERNLLGQGSNAGRSI